MESLYPPEPQSSPIDPMDKFSPVEPAQSTPTPAETPAPPANSIAPQQSTPIHKSRKPMIVILSLLIVLVLLLGGSAFVGLVAYGKVGINNDELERKISFAVQSLPFTPKTADYLLYQTFESQKDLKSVFLDASVAFSSSGLQVVPGLGNNFDLKITGPIDLHDEENPQAEINLVMTPELDADFVAKDDVIYFKVNEIPAAIKGMASGAGYPIDLFLSKWIYYDLKTITSDARSNLNADKTVRDEEQFERMRTAILSSKLIKKIKVSNVNHNGVDAYQLSLEMSGDEYNEFVMELLRSVDPGAYGDQFMSTERAGFDFVDNIKVNSIVDKATYHTLNSSISFRIKQANFSGASRVLGISTVQNLPNLYTATDPQNTHMDVAFVVNTSRFNEQFDIKAPEGAVSIEVVMEEMSKAAMEKYQSEFESVEDGIQEIPEDDYSGIVEF